MLCALRCRSEGNRDAFRRAAIGRGFPGAAERRSPSGWRATRGSRTFLASESPLRASARRAETSPASAAASTLLAESPNEAALGVRRTDFCLLTFRTSTRASLVPELRHARGKARAHPGDRLVHVSAILLRRAAPSSRGVTALGVVFPRGVCWPSLRHLCRLSLDADRARARVLRRESRRGRLLRVRVNEARG
jgi:hypothetical protein